MESHATSNFTATVPSRMSVAYRRIEELKPDPTNPRRHTKKQIGQIANSIKAFGFTNPVLIDDAGTILAGHGRVAAAKLLGMKQVPCVRLSDMSTSQKRAYVLADNKLAERRLGRGAAGDRASGPGNA